MASVKISFVATVLNEEDSISTFLDSVVNQTKKPDEVIIVDGGSTDSTLSVISNFKFQISDKDIKFKFYVRKGNRAVGRNEAIKNSTGNIIACSDAGCILDRNWIKLITEPFNNPKVDVVAGYYRGVYSNTFEKSIIPYFLVMEDKVDPENFLPATRSMAFRKSVWEKVGGFPEHFSNNEDYVFAHKLKKTGAKIIFKKEAIVYWSPKKDLKEAIISFYRFAKGDIESGILRPKIMFLFLRYLLATIILSFFLITKTIPIFYLLLTLIIIYFFWSILKNYKYVNDLKAFYYLPIIQVSSDIAVMIGSVVGFF